MEEERTLEEELAALEAEYLSGESSEEVPDTSVSTNDIVEELGSLNVIGGLSQDYLEYDDPQEATIQSTFHNGDIRDLPGFEIIGIEEGKLLTHCMTPTQRLVGWYVLVLGEVNGSYKVRTWSGTELVFDFEIQPQHLSEFSSDESRLSSVIRVESMLSNLAAPTKEKDKPKISKTLQSRIDTVKEIAEEIHPDCWDLQKVSDLVGVTSNGTPGNVGVNWEYRLIIHFPEFEISNTARRTHKIHDLYTIIYFDRHMKHIYNGIMGMRTSYSVAELHTGYAHSHLSGISFKPNNFCLGSGVTVSLIGGLVADGWDPDNLRNLLMLLYTYVAHESTEGGPYQYMSNIAIGGRRRFSYISDAILLIKSKNIVKNLDLMKKLDFKFTTVGGIQKFILEPNKALEDNLVISLESSQLVYRTPDGTYMERDLEESGSTCSNENTLTSYNMSDNNLLFFKGKHVKYQVLGKETINTANYEIVPREYIVNKVVTNLENLVNKYHLKKLNYELS